MQLNSSHDSRWDLVSKFLPLAVYVTIVGMMWFFLFREAPERPPAVPAAQEKPLDKKDALAPVVKEAGEQELPPTWQDRELWGGYLDLAAGVSRQDVRNRLSTHFAEHDARRNARSILERMVTEDDEYEGKPWRIMWLRPRTERIADLIFRLRDQTCVRRYPWDEWTVFENKSLPAAQLEAFGAEAVPALLNHIEDNRFTRALVMPSNGRFELILLRIGDCSLAIVERFAARKFSGDQFIFLHHRGKPADAKKSAVDWWNGYQQKGERQMLIEGTAAGDDNSVTQAERLFEKHPKDALASVRLGLKNSKEEKARRNLMNQVHNSLSSHLYDPKELPGEIRDFYQDLVDDRDSSVRIAAAGALARHGDAAAVAVLQREWARVRKDLFVDYSDVLTVLAQSKSRIAIQTLGKDWNAYPAGVRLQIVERFRDIHADDAVHQDIEALLFSALGDTDVAQGAMWQGDKGIYANPRICDRAAAGLAFRWLGEPELGADAPLDQRNQRIERLRKIGRVKPNDGNK